MPSYQDDPDLLDAHAPPAADETHTSTGHGPSPASQSAAAARPLAVGQQRTQHVRQPDGHYRQITVRVLGIARGR